MPRRPNTTELVDELLDRQEGILRCVPTYVHRFYKDGDRMGQTRRLPDTQTGMRAWQPERWIASGTIANSGSVGRREGLTRLAMDSQGPNNAPTLQDAFRQRGSRLLGSDRHHAHGAEFRVLIKLLDSFDPIPFHFHAGDEAVIRHPRHFQPHRFGKDEAYYFLDRPRGHCPYTHVGLNAGTRPRDLKEAILNGSERTLELSPSFYQRAEEGFFVPAGVVHRPGTALTLEIQQPSDVYTLLEDAVNGVSLPPELKHPGFDRLSHALKFIDYDTCCQPDLLDRYRLLPEPVLHQAARGSKEVWIFPPSVCRKFSAKRLRVTTRATSIERDCHAVLIWRGAGRFGSHEVRSGDELFVSHEAATAGVTITRDGGDCLEIFKFFAAPV